MTASRAIVVSSFISVLASGCIVARDDTPPPPVYTPPPPAPAASVPVYRIQPGAATVVDASNPGYAITANVGGSFRMVWTGNSGGSFSEFRGYAYTPGSFLSVTPGCSDGSCALERGDSVSGPQAVAGGGEQVVFDTFAADGLDGFDFTVDVAGEPVEIYGEVQGSPVPSLVFFTSADTGVVSNPASLPFALTTQ
jgi:hypothetical protein